MSRLVALLARLRPEVRAALQRAVDDTATRTQYVVEIEHLLLALLDDAGSDLPGALSALGIEVRAVGGELAAAITRLPGGAREAPSLSVLLHQLLESAWLVASVDHDLGAIGSLCLLHAGLEDSRVRGRLLETVPSLAGLARAQLVAAMPRLLANSREGRGGGGALAEFTIDLTERAAAGGLDPVLGREAEIEQVIEILLRRRQSNPLLVGPAGVGKTAIVEGLAQRIVAGRVPAALAELRLRVLDLGAVRAGTRVQGAYEERLRAILATAGGDDANCLLFIDEAHMLLGGGDTADLLKPALARGALRVIGATTWAEYRRHFEGDAALSRRFQPVKVAQPSPDVAITILRQLAPRLEAHHGVRILEEALPAAVAFAQRYLADRQLPDSAITALDTACARVAIAQSDRPAALGVAGARCAALAAERNRREHEVPPPGDGRDAQLALLLEQAEELRAGIASRWAQERDTVDRLRRLGGGAPVATATIGGLELELAELQREAPIVPRAVDRRAMAAVVAGWTGLPADAILGSGTGCGDDLRDRLGRRILGQPEAIDTIVRRVHTFQAGLGDPAKPTGVFLLCGPSGVGKTETAVALAELLFGGSQALITVNMSEYQEAHSVSGLKGAPPGYVGFGRGGVLTEAVRRQPYAVLLLDEIEKAHPDVLELFYQVFDRGTIDDSEGVAVDFSHSLILLTSNLGAELLARPSRRRFDRMAALRHALLRRFSPAFLGRLTIVPYHPLSADRVAAIATLKLGRIGDRFASVCGGELSWDRRVIAWIAAEAQRIDAGARGIDAVLDHHVLPALSTRMAGDLASRTGPRYAHLGIAAGGTLVVEGTW